MRKIIAMALAIVALVLGSATVNAVELYPSVDGKDVLVPDLLIQAIPGFDPDKSVYAATDINGWFVRGSKFTSKKVVEATQMQKEGDVWRAKGLRGRRFHPVQLDEDGKPQWAKIEEVYPIESEFVDNSGTGPCLLVK